MSRSAAVRRAVPNDGLWTEADVLALLAERFGPPTFAFLTAVRNGTGWTRAPRTADALAMCTWPSRGLHLYGFEVKVARADWRREEKDPRKADEIASRCHFWHVVAPAGVVPVEELPPPWGLLECSRSTDGAERGAVKVTKPAALLEPKALDHVFLAAILRRVSEDTVPRALVEARVRAAVEHGTAERVDTEIHRAKMLEERLAEQTQRIAAFERESGVAITHGWTPAEKIGRAVRQVLEATPERVRTQLAATRAQLARLMEQIDSELAGGTPEDAA